MNLSVVVPVYNEEGSLGKLYDALTRALASLGREYEIICVDDGSIDGSFRFLSKLHRRDPRLKVLSFRRNFGQTAAMSAGFDHAQGVLKKLDEGYDIVSGWRHQRQDNPLRVFPSKVANRLISLLSGVRLHDYGCSLKAYRREVIENIRLYGDMHRFIPAVAKQVGAKVAEVRVRHHPRRFGKSKYGFSRILKVFLDLFLLKFLLSFQTRPLRLFGSLGLLSGGAGLVTGAYLSYVRLVQQQPIANRPLLLLAILLMVLGVQLVMMGLLGELMIRTYFESQGKKTYILRQQLL